MLLDQCVQMGIIHYGQQHYNQNQQQHQQHYSSSSSLNRTNTQQQQYNPADMRTRQSNADARTLFGWKQER
jgi:hypothetical protein